MKMVARLQGPVCLSRHLKGYMLRACGDGEDDAGVRGRWCGGDHTIHLTLRFLVCPLEWAAASAFTHGPHSSQAVSLLIAK